MQLIPPGRGERGLLERGKPSPVFPIWWPQLVPLKCLLLWSVRAGLPLCLTLAKRGVGRAWWLQQGWRGWQAVQELWGQLGGDDGLWLSLGTPSA